MKKFRNTGNLIISFLINILLGIELLIPAIILLILHFVINIPLFWFWICLGISLLIVLIRTIVLTFAVNTKEPDTYKKSEVKYTLKDNEKNK